MVLQKSCLAHHRGFEPRRASGFARVPGQQVPQSSRPGRFPKTIPGLQLGRVSGGVRLSPVSTRKWLAIVIAPLAYLLAYAVPVAMAGFQGLPGDAGWLGLAVFHSVLCAVMAAAFALGRGLGSLVGAYRQGHPR